MYPNSTGTPHIVYSNLTYANNLYTRNLMYAEEKDSGWKISTIETHQSNTISNYYPVSITIDSKGYPHIIYEDEQDYNSSTRTQTTDIKYAGGMGLPGKFKQ